MRPRCLLSHVERLPTISELQESDCEEGEEDGDGMDEYMESIRELSQPPQPCYPLHGPLRGHRRWANCPGTYPVFLTLRDRRRNAGRGERCLNQHMVDKLVAQTLFAGL